MIAYDAFGHLTAFIARNTGDIGARLWNGYSRMIWPAITSPSAYDAYWASWHFIAVALIIAGHFTTRYAAFSLTP
jgi:hypothetical protein